MPIAALAPETIAIGDIKVNDRMRKDMGDIPSMVASIKEFGLIQPIILGDDNVLIAGGRRLEALKALGLTELVHIEHWIRKDETDATDEGRLRMKGMELEENLRRKEMTWPEQVAAKKQLFEIMEKIHGPQKIGGLTKNELVTGTTEGFGVRKLAAMLGEAPSTVSQDLKLATLAEINPAIKTVQSKSVAITQATGYILAAAIKAKMIQASQVPKNIPMPGQANATLKPLAYKVLVECKDEQEQASLMAELMSKGYKCQAVIV